MREQEVRPSWNSMHPIPRSFLWKSFMSFINGCWQAVFLCRCLLAQVTLLLYLSIVCVCSVMPFVASAQLGHIGDSTVVFNNTAHALLGFGAQSSIFSLCHRDPISCDVVLSGQISITRIKPKMTCLHCNKMKIFNKLGQANVVWISSLCCRYWVGEYGGCFSGKIRKTINAIALIMALSRLVAYCRCIG